MKYFLSPTGLSEITLSVDELFKQLHPNETFSWTTAAKNYLNLLLLYPNVIFKHPLSHHDSVKEISDTKSSVIHEYLLSSVVDLHPSLEANGLGLLVSEITFEDDDFHIIMTLVDPKTIHILERKFHIDQILRTL